MENRKITVIIAAMLTILGTFLFAMYGISGTTTAGSGIGFYQNLGNIFTNANSIGTSLGGVWIVYLIVIIMIFFTFSGFLQLTGLKSRIAIFIFSLLPLIISILMILLTYTDILKGVNQIGWMIGILEHEQIIPNAIPLILEIDTVNHINLGTFLVLSGGVVGIVSTFLAREN